MKEWYGIILVLFGVCACVCTCATGVFTCLDGSVLSYKQMGVGVMFYDTRPI